MPKWVDECVPQQILSMPPYVPGKPVTELEREFGVTDAIKMASNENPLGPSPKALNAVKEHLSQIHVYPESSSPDLRAALAAHYRVSPDSAIIGNGSDEILQLATHAFMRPGDEAIVLERTFSMYRICVESFGGVVREARAAGYDYDLAAISRAVTSKTRLIFLAVPNNPTGTVFSAEDFRRFLGDLPDERLLVVLDEAYGEYVTDPNCVRGVEFIGSKPSVLVLRTFSKLYGLAGLRVGYGLSEEWLVELMNRIRPPFNVNSLAQAAASAALEDEEHVRRTLEVNEEGMNYLCAELARLGLEVVPSQANFICFRFAGDARPIYESLLRQGVIVRHLASFGMKRCMRVTVGTRERNRRFINALTRAIDDERPSGAVQGP
jgi:histidinol-phosphate aminotransferase